MPCDNTMRRKYDEVKIYQVLLQQLMKENKKTILSKIGNKSGATRAPLPTEVAPISNTGNPQLTVQLSRDAGSPRPWTMVMEIPLGWVRSKYLGLWIWNFNLGLSDHYSQAHHNQVRGCSMEEESGCEESVDGISGGVRSNFEFNIG